MFTCCHPSLNLDAQVALTLRSLAGMSTAEIARAFLVPERTMGQRLFRAKQKVAHAGIPFRVPPPHLLPERLPAVLHVLYLLFNEGYGHPGETRLPREAIRLARVLTVLMPDEPEAHGMLALMLLHDARRPARTDARGNLVTLDEQDRSLWDAGQIAEGTAILDRALRRHRAGPFQIQAAIAACHATAPAADQTDWPQIVGLYGQLALVAPSVIVDLNRAVAVGMADGPQAALPLVDAIAGTGQLDGYYLLHATRADLLRRAGRLPEAGESYRRALGLAPTEAERRFLPAGCQGSDDNGRCGQQPLQPGDRGGPGRGTLPARGRGGLGPPGAGPDRGPAPDRPAGQAGHRAAGVRPDLHRASWRRSRSRSRAAAGCSRCGCRRARASRSAPSRRTATAAGR